MIKKKKSLKTESIPEFRASIDAMPEDSKIFVDKSLEIAHHIILLMRQKGMKQKDLAEKMGKSEAEISKLLGGMHNYTLRSIAKLEAALGSTVIHTKPISHVFTHQLKTYPTTSAQMLRTSYKRSYHNIMYGTKVVTLPTAKQKNNELVAI
ncbi:MAG: helix-turn-helix transcriptional regulator [Bacteroidetes bacterium]|nr:helix-turn-helix transcriptional regulator [Bacteroidota bacterium]